MFMQNFIKLSDIVLTERKKNLATLLKTIPVASARSKNVYSNCYHRL